MPDQETPERRAEVRDLWIHFISEHTVGPNGYRAFVSVNSGMYTTDKEMVANWRQQYRENRAWREWLLSG